MLTRLQQSSKLTILNLEAFGSGAPLGSENLDMYVTTLRTYIVKLKTNGLMAMLDRKLYYWMITISHALDII